MREAFITRPAGALTRARQAHIDQISSKPQAHPGRTQSDSATVVSYRRTPKRVVVTKRPLHTPFELRNPKLFKPIKAKLRRQKPVSRNARPVITSRRSSVTSPSCEQTPLAQPIPTQSDFQSPPPPHLQPLNPCPQISPIPSSSQQEVLHLPSTPVHITRQRSLFEIQDHILAPRTPSSPNNTEFFELPPQELLWDDFSPTPSFIEFSNILEEALDQLYIEEEQEREIPESAPEDLRLPLDDNLPGTAANASTSTTSV